MVVLGTASAHAGVTRVRAGDSLRLPAGTDPVARLVLVGRARGCSRASATIRIDTRAYRTVHFGRHARRASITLAAAPLPSRVEIVAGGCDLDVERLAAVPAPRSVPLGTAITEHPLSDPQYVATLTSSFASVTTENELKMDHTQPREGDWEFGSADRVIGFAVRHGLPIRGHTLIFGTQTPNWVHHLPLAALVEKALTDQVTTVMDRYKDRIHEWDVVNEALAPDGGWRHNPFYDKLGPIYVDDAFRAARAADPQAQLFYNEIGAEFPNLKRTAMLALVGHLASEHLIDGVGLQMHVAINRTPSYEQLVDTMNAIAALGLKVEITEMDVTADGLGFRSDRLARQAQVYATAGRACRAVPACQRFTVWGVSDRFSWLTAARLPLLFDTDYQAKPALTALRTALGDA